MEGLFSIKSDVYSYGVLLLEIISGKRNSSFYQENSSSNVVGHVREPHTDLLVLELIKHNHTPWFPDSSLSTLHCYRFGSCGKKESAWTLLTRH